MSRLLLIALFAAVGASGCGSLPMQPPPAESAPASEVHQTSCFWPNEANPPAAVEFDRAHGGIQ